MSPRGLRLARLILYQGQRYLLWREHGQPRRKSVARYLDIPPRQVTDVLARQALDRLNEEIYRDKLHRAGAERITLGDCFARIAEDLELAQLRSAAGARRDLEGLTASIGHWRVSRITDDDIRALVRTWVGTYAANTLHKKAGWVKRALRLAHHKEWLGRLPEWPRLPAQTVRQSGVTPEMWRQIRPQLDRTPPEDAFADALEFGFLTGWRSGEIVGLGWTALDLAQRLLRFDRTKNQRPLILPVDDEELWTLLGRRWQARVLGCPQVFHRYGAPLTRPALLRRLKAAGHAAGLPELLWVHDLRRAAVTNMIDAGVAPHTAMLLSNHKTLSMLTRYHIVSIEPLRAAVQQVRKYVATRQREANSRQVFGGTPGTPQITSLFPDDEHAVSILF